MKDDNRKSILEMARGAFLERADCEMARVIENILDPNTSAREKRKLTLTLEFKPDDTRQNIAVSCTVKAALAPMNPSTTFLYVAGEESVVEMAPQIPGQLSMDEGEQEAPPRLKVIKTA